MVRLMHFKSVDLPELAGPMMAKICMAANLQRHVQHAARP